MGTHFAAEYLTFRISITKKKLCFYLLSLDRIQVYFSFGFTPEKLKLSWFIVLATTAFFKVGGSQNLR